MSDHEIHKEKVVIHHDHSSGEPDLREDRIPYSETIREDVHIHDHEPYRVDHIYYNNDPSSRDRRQDIRTRGKVKSEILSFRRGVYGILNILNIFLVIEFFIRLFSAPANNPFVSFVNIITYPFIAPFGSFVTWISPYFAIHWSILLAMIAYAIVAYVLVALFESSIRSVYRRT